MLDRNGGRADHGWEQRMLLQRLVARLQARWRWDRNRLEAEGMMLRIREVLGERASTRLTLRGIRYLGQVDSEAEGIT
jgi:hypothetical protein